MTFDAWTPCGPLKRYCSRSCRQKASYQTCAPRLAQKRLADRVARGLNRCRTCNTPVAGLGRRYCSRACTPLRTLRSKPGGIAGLPPAGVVDCARCHRPFQQVRANARFCSQKCALARPWAERRFDPSVRDHNQRKRAIRKGVYVTKIDRRLLYYVHGGGTCALCGALVDTTATARTAGTASLDHITPLSRGGVHDWPNVQLAHFGCNSAKGAA